MEEEDEKEEEEAVSTSSNPQPGGPPLAGCPQLLIQYIRSYLPVGGRSSMATRGLAMPW
jgi:hypothetical protein